MRQALEMALEALEKADKIRGFPNNKKAITAIKEALAQPEQEPVGCIPWHWVDKAKQIADGTIAYPDVERAQQAIALIKILLKSTPPQRTEQEPVVWTEKVGGLGFKEPMPNANYKVIATIAPQRKPLTDEQMPAGWVFYTSDFSMRAAGKSVKGSVLLVRDEAGRKWWLGLEGNRDSDDFPPLYVGAEGETFEQAIANATDKARAIEAAHGIKE